MPQTPILTAIGTQVGADCSSCYCLVADGGRWIVLEGFFHRFVAQIDVFFRGISAGILPPNHVANTHQRDPMGITVLHGGSVWQWTRLQTERVESDNTIPMGKPVR